MKQKEIQETLKSWKALWKEYSKVTNLSTCFQSIRALTAKSLSPLDSGTDDLCTKVSEYEPAEHAGVKHRPGIGLQPRGAIVWF